VFCFGKLGITPIYQESPKDIAKRLNKKIKKEVAPFIEMAAIASQERRRSREMRETITEKDKYIRKIDQLFLGLTDDQIHYLFTLIRKIKHENEIKNSKNKEAEKKKKCRYESYAKPPIRSKYSKIGKKINPR